MGKSDYYRTHTEMWNTGCPKKNDTLTLSPKFRMNYPNSYGAVINELIKNICRKLYYIRFSGFENYVIGLFHTFENTQMKCFEHIHHLSSSELLNRIKHGAVMHK